MYEFSDQERSVLEGLTMPLAVYQYIDKRIVPLLLSDGFRAMLGYDDLETAYANMNHDVYNLAHPDDVARISDVAFRLAAEDGDREVVYRTRTLKSDVYKVVHAVGTHVLKETGVRLDYVWYTEEGSFAAEAEEDEMRLNLTLNDLLREESRRKAGHYDHLTGLPNMTYFFELAEAGRIAIQRGGGQPVMLYMDLSGMKYFNHRFGFAEGDKLLKEFAALLARTFSNESCCHIGQDHFAAYAAEEGLENVLDGLIRGCAALNGGNTLPVHIGIYPNRAGELSASLACDRAKIACDEIRQTYSSGYRTYVPELREDARLRQYLQTHLDQALAEGWVQVYYQPIVRAANQKVCNDEALSRWIDPERGMISPADFIPCLEDSGQIYKLDLYVLEQVAEKMRFLKENGFRIVPHSINLSRSDFESCDIVEEIVKRVDAAGVDRRLIAVEITESTIGSDFDRMKKQVERFRELGFQVWLDDFGSGYSSLDALQSIRFDLIKFDMSFMKKLGESEDSRIVLTELVKLATTLGADTVCEGVETERQVQFLQEIGCSKLQGFYYSQPLPLEKVLERHRNPVIGYENPDEVPYYEAIGKINLYDLAAIGGAEENGLQNFFNTLPIGIIEVRGETSRFVRSNQSYRDFVKRFLGFDLAREGTEFVPYDDDFVDNVVKTCCEQGTKALYDQQLPNGAIVHSFARRIGANPVNGTTAVLAAVLSISYAAEGATYASIARALASDYYNIYCVDLDTEHFIEYSSPAGREGLAMERHGEGFFASVARDAVTRIYPEDQAPFLRSFTKENILRELDAHGVYNTSYRLVDSGVPLYAGMKVTRMQPGGNQIIMGISIIDAQVKLKAEAERTRQERTALGRLAALAGNYIAVYSVDPETGSYVEYSAVADYAQYGLAKEGDDFFAKTREESPKYVAPEDLPRFMEVVYKESVLREIARSGLFALDYRLLMNGVLIPVSLRATLVRESDGEKLIVGINTVATQDKPEAGESKSFFQQMVDRQVKPCSLLSVEKGPNGAAGEIRIVCANDAYKRTMGSKYYDNMPYYELVPKVLRFENSCYRCAIEHQQIHVYTQTKVNELWTDQQLIPLSSDREDLGYCLFIMELSEARDRDRMAAVPVRTATSVLRAAITLLGTNDLKERVGTVLSDILEFSEAFSVRVMLVDHENKRAINYCDRWSIVIDDDYIPPEEDPDQAMISYPLICSWEKCIGNENILIVTCEDEMNALEPLNPTWVATMRAYGVTTLILVPLRHEREIIGYLYLCNFNPNKVQDIRELAELMSFFLGTEIYNEVLLRRLDEMSHTDALTGLNNRNSMIRRTNEITQSAEKLPFGVVNLDLNGLKTVNDYQGHDAGDQLLIEAAEMLKRFFREEDLYRTGGDEFIIISTGITEEAFNSRLAQLRSANCSENGALFAIGAFWSDGGTDAITAFRYADERMYEDKKAFYDAHPEQKR